MFDSIFNYFYVTQRFPDSILYQAMNKLTFLLNENGKSIIDIKSISYFVLYDKCY